MNLGFRFSKPSSNSTFLQQGHTSPNSCTKEKVYSNAWDYGGYFSFKSPHLCLVNKARSTLTLFGTALISMQVSPLSVCLYSEVTSGCYSVLQSSGCLPLWFQRFHIILCFCFPNLEQQPVPCHSVNLSHIGERINLTKTSLKPFQEHLSWVRCFWISLRAGHVICLKAVCMPLRFWKQLNTSFGLP